MELSKQIRTLALGAAMTLSVVGTPALHAVAATPEGAVPSPDRLTTVVVPAQEAQAGSTSQDPASIAEIGIPISPVVTLIQPDNGTAVAAAVGQSVALSLPAAQLNWSVSVSNQSVLVPETGPLPAGDQGLWQAASAGQSVITATGRPVCNPGAICPQFIMYFQATVDVSGGGSPLIAGQP